MVDESRLAELYDKLAEQIVEMIPVEWDKIYFLGDVDKESQSASVSFYFVDGEDKNTIIKADNIPEVYDVSEEDYMDLISEIYDTTYEIYNCFIENEQEPWEQLSMFFDNEGDFSVDYLYDVAHGNDGGAHVREIFWAYKTFGYEPEEGNSNREILDAYLAYQENGDTSIDFWKFKERLK